VAVGALGIHVELGQAIEDVQSLLVIRIDLQGLVVQGNGTVRADLGPQIVQAVVLMRFLDQVAGAVGAPHLWQATSQENPCNAHGTTVAGSLHGRRLSLSSPKEPGPQHPVALAAGRALTSPMRETAQALKRKIRIFSRNRGFLVGGKYCHAVSIVTCGVYRWIG
jgi:hypothetical protein